MSISYLSIGGNPIGGVQINNSGDGSSIYNLDGFIITVYISDWRSFSKTDQEKVISKRRSLGIHKGQGSARSDRSGGGNSSAMSSSQFKHLQKKTRSTRVLSSYLRRR